MPENRIILTDSTDAVLRSFLDGNGLRPALLLTDANVCRCCLPMLPELEDLPRVVITPGEEQKSMESVMAVWSALEECKARRNSLLVNLGGGLVSDLGGFAASCFKRGIRFINISTSLLADVDASIGGKTGVNFAGLKNEIGLFSWPEVTIVGADLLVSLPREELLSGYGEMLKTGFISDAALLQRLMRLAPDRLDAPSLAEFIRPCIDFKKRITEEDPTESGKRKILNFGHTAGHAFESLMLAKQRPAPHGICVAYGILTALIISNITYSTDSSLITSYASLLRASFPPIAFSCDDYGELLRLMHSDKKNDDGAIRFTLLRGIGDPVTAVAVGEETIRTALDITRDCLGI